MAYTSINKPTTIKIGAMVMRVLLYTSLFENILGSALLPPLIKNIPNAITSPPTSINMKFSFENSGVVLLVVLILNIYRFLNRIANID